MKWIETSRIWITFLLSEQPIFIMDGFISRDSQVLKELKDIQGLNYSHQVSGEAIYSLEIFENKGLSNPPTCIQFLDGLTYLTLLCNDHVRFPPWICKMVNLRHLNVAGNRIERIPGCILSLKSLKHLDVGSNPLIELPKEIENLPRLESLSIADTKLEIPAWLGNLENLTELDISKNSLRVLPGWIENLNSLRKLSSWSNKLKTVPEWILNLENLQVLDLRWQKVSIETRIINALVDRGCRISFSYGDSRTVKHYEQCRKDYLKTRENKKPRTNIETNSIMGNLNEWCGVHDLVKALKINNLMDVRFVQLKLKALDKQGLLSISFIDGKRMYKRKG